jgi:hypothetical protein
MLDIIDDWLRASGVGMERDPMDPSGMRGRRVYSRVDGATPSTTRQRVIESFNSEESVTFLMLVSTRAGGLGLNLATADTVIMYDPDFNPFVDEQAQSRAHRMGQRKEVVVYQLVTAATVEERIVELAKSKRAVERLVVKRGRDESDAPDESVPSAEIGDESRRLTKHGSVSRAAELAKVLMHGARKIVTRAAATSAEAAKSAAFLEKKVNAKCEFKDSEIERLLDRENLPVEADGEDGDGYLGGVGDGRVHLENDEDEDDAVGRTTDPEEDDETRRGGDDPEDLADKQLESLLAERAARLVSAERELLGRGKRERRTVLPTNVFPRKGKKRGKDKRASSKGDRASESDADDLNAEDPGPVRHAVLHLPGRRERRFGGTRLLGGGSRNATFAIRRAFAVRVVHGVRAPRVRGRGRGGRRDALLLGALLARPPRVERKARVALRLGRLILRAPREEDRRRPRRRGGGGCAEREALEREALEVGARAERLLRRLRQRLDGRRKLCQRRRQRRRVRPERAQRLRERERVPGGKELPRSKEETPFRREGTKRARHSLDASREDARGVGEPARLAEAPDGERR